MSDDLFDDVIHELVVEGIVEGVKIIGKGLAELFTELSKELILEGKVGYTIDHSDSTVNLRIDKVRNKRSSKSGTLKLNLWATDELHEGGCITGYIIATKTIGELKGGWYKYDINYWVDYKAPPSGIYYITLGLEEYGHDGKYHIFDFVNFDKRIQF